MEHTNPTNEQQPSPLSKSIIVESSQQDDRLYKTHVLPNNLQCLLISDPTTDKASAGLDVRVGHLSDPDSISGLAHFLEHMLFMGTEKYPSENEYSSFLNSHGGSSNAFTDMESTNYYFDVSVDNLESALDRFAQFFIAPLFTISSTEREMNAVDSEHAKNLQSDSWRMFQLLKSLSKEGHPFGKFGSGNLETLDVAPKELGIDLHEALLEFHKTYYSSNVMKLVVLGKESLDELTEMVTTYFSEVPNQDLVPPVIPPHPYGDDQLKKRIHVIPVREVRLVELNFPLPEIDSMYLSKPTRYISHLIGHEGSGSILALLKELGWANELSAGESRSCSSFATFAISVELTEEGMAHVLDVVQIIISYLGLLRSKGPQEWIHDETSTVADCNFRFLSKRNPMDYTCSLAGAMQLYPPEHYLSGPYKIYDYDPQAITEIMSFLVPRKMILTVQAKSFEDETTQKEKWYGTDYSIMDIEEELLVQWTAASFPDTDSIDGRLSLPEPNDMIASDFDLRDTLPEFPKDEPRLLIDDDTCRLWFKPDNVFEMPKLNVMAQILLPEALTSLDSRVLTGLWVMILNEHCTEFTYLASMANLHCSFSCPKMGIDIYVSGFNHKLNVLMKRIVDAITELPDKLQNDSDLFDRIKDKAMKKYQNYLFAQPYSHAINGADICLETNETSMQDKIATLSEISIEDLVSFSHRLLRRFKLEILIHGNASPEEAKSIASTILDGLKPLPLLKSDIPNQRVVRIQENVVLHRFSEFNPENTNSCVASVYQVGPVDLSQNATLACLNHIIQEPAFNELRTKEQLGYIVHTSMKTSGDRIKSMLVLIQSDSYDPIYLDGRIEAFLAGFRDTVVQMSSEEFATNVEAVVKQLLEKNKNLGEESSKYWSSIQNKEYLFQKYQLVAKECEKMTKERVLRCFDKYFCPGGVSRRKLCVQVFGKNHLDKLTEEVKEDEAKLVKAEDVVEFKNGCYLFPVRKTVDVEGMKI